MTSLLLSNPQGGRGVGVGVAVAETGWGLHLYLQNNRRKRGVGGWGGGGGDNKSYAPERCRDNLHTNLQHHNLRSNLIMD